MDNLKEYQKEKRRVDYQKHAVFYRARSKENYQKQKEYKKVWEELSVKLDKI